MEDLLNELLVNSLVTWYVELFDAQLRIYSVNVFPL